MNKKGFEFAWNTTIGIFLAVILLLLALAIIQVVSKGNFNLLSDLFSKLRFG